MLRKYLGDFGRCLGGVEEVFRRFWKVFRRCLGSVWEVFGRYLRDV